MDRRQQLEILSNDELISIFKKLNILNLSWMEKDELIDEIIDIEIIMKMREREKTTLINEFEKRIGSNCGEFRYRIFMIDGKR